ncbi:MAG: 16S rRNA (adenine(1518)-N(6)/adenine(1519)-N(6))-dimethyltransferase RsmA [Candidatus Adiutrix sp.]|jgi:16S rRNA (adenine1518-N6/adenine1519-N6)-dimethyltransferase|nr:16S rRNA (adenine(1518)-N(6)/adenine(1519)-N(6))-dimethyltransferase RsmA [Candidatus Adiutrix sp.]
MNQPLIRDTLKELGLAPAKSRGQNFLKDETQIARLAGSILTAAGAKAALVEIGPGLGALTRPFLEAGARVTAVEIDRGLAENLTAGLAADYPGRLTVLHRDILRLGADDLPRATPLYLCGNLPYNISSPVLFWFLSRRRFFSGAMFMLQKEMARRLTAEPGTKEYGRLTVALSLWSRVAEIMVVPPSAFHPRPRVESVVVALTPVSPAEEPTVSPAALGRLTAAAFAARRKTILNNLGEVYGRERSALALESLGLNPAWRAEVLAPATLAQLAARLES